MEVYADVLELIARALLNAILWAAVAVVVGAAVVAMAGADWLPMVAALAPLSPALAVVLTVRGHAGTIREQHRRATYNRQH